MAIRNIVKTGNEILSKNTKKVVSFDDNLSLLLDDMYETMLENDGIGLAAPQVGVLKQIAVVEVNGTKLDLINPEIIYTEGEEEGVEGCLSVPNVNGYVNRPTTIIVRAVDRDNVPFELKCSGLLARCICHELDHLKGVLFTDIMTRPYVPKQNKKDEK